MADRVKYFLLGVLFLVVAGVIAYDRWNRGNEGQEVAGNPADDTTDDWHATAGLKVDNPVPAVTNQGTTPPATVTNDPPVVEHTPPPATPPNPAPATPPGPKPEPKPEPAPAKAQDMTHVIQKGETLEAIAIKYYGTREGISWIVSANGLKNANRIYVNQKLVIPARKELTKSGGPGGAKPAEKPAASSGKVPSPYKVREGDGDLYKICRRFYGAEGLGARVSQILETNHLWSANVTPGTVLILPAK
jgi:nucleoid-associated protein YgaU